MFENPKRVNPRSNSSDSGSTLIEFSLALPIIVLVLLGIIQYGMVVLTDLALQSAAAHIARTATLAGAAVNGSSVNAMATNAVGPFVDAAHLSTDFDATYEDGTGRNDAFWVELQYDMPIMFPLVVPQANNGTLTITRESVMR